MNQVLDSIGLDVGAQMSKAAPSKAPLGSQSKQKTREDIEIEKMLAGMP